MLTFATADGNFTAKIGGRIYLIYRHLFDRDDVGGAANPTSADSFGMDTARFQLDGTFFKDFYYRLEGEAQSQAQTGFFKLKEDYIGWTLNDYLSIQGGQMKIPWSQEETTSSRFIDFAERSILNRLTPTHDIGLLFKGSFADRIFEWNAGVFNTALNRDAGRNTPDTSDEKDFVARLFVSPFRNAGGAFGGLRFGVDVTVGDIDGNVAQGDLTTGDLGATLFTDFAGALLDGRRTRALLNFSWLFGPASLRAEYATVKQELIDGTSAGDYEIKAFYVQATFLLTGETKPLENRVKPNANFSPLNGQWGAWELAVRFAKVDASDAEDITNGATTLLNTGAGALAPGETNPNTETTELTFGINWWLAPNVAVRFDFEHFMFDRDLVGIKTGNEDADSQDVFYVRWQIDF
jgi:phosphate-selective porin OprO and OprP